LTKKIFYNSVTLNAPLVWVLLIVLVLTGLVSRAGAINADSLGGNHWTSYLRSNVADTANGPLYLNQVNWLSAEAAAGKQMMQWKNYGNGISGYNYSLTAPLFYGINSSILQPWMELRADSAGPGLLKLHGNTAQTTQSNIISIDQLGQYSIGLAIYANQGTGIYAGYSGSNTAIKISNSSTTAGTGLQIDNQNNGTAMYVSDIKNGRLIVTSQDSANKPAITVGYKYGPTFRDSAMLYPWGLRSRKVVADTLWGRFVGMLDSSVIAGKTNLLRSGNEYISGDKYLRTDKIDTAQFVVFDSIKAGKIVDLTVATSTNSNYLLYGSSYQPGTAYLRSTAADTANGPLYLNQVNWLYAEAAAGKQMMQWKNNGNGILGYNYSSTAPLFYGINSSILQPWMELRADSAGPGLIRLHGSSVQTNTNDIIFIDQLGQNTAGLGIYNTKGTGIYIDHGGDKMGIRIENNFMSTGYGLFIDNQNNGTAMYVSDIKNGRLIVTSQDSANKPAITVGYKYGPTFRDSAMLYPWGLKSRKAAIDTIRTALSGRRYFGNQQKNLCDTFRVWGVAESTTVVIATYGKDVKAASWNALQAWPGKDTIFVKRRALTDPDNYYWRADKTVEGSQIQATPYNTGVEGPPETVAALTTTVKLEQSYPNPTASDAFISYQVAREGPVSLAVYNMLGQKVRLLVEQPQPAGTYKIRWDGRNQQGQSVSSGIYFYELKTEDIRITKRLVLAK